MDQTHIHLLITHLPIFGSFLGGLVLAHGLWTKNNQTNIAAYNVFIVSAIGAGIAYLTGEAAEETVENIQGVAANMIEAHEEFALFALISLITLGVASIGSVYLTWIKSSLTNAAATAVFIICLISFGLVARTGYLGGQIRHTEVSNSTIATQGEGAESEEED